MKIIVHLLYLLAFLPWSSAQMNDPYSFNVPPDGFITNKSYLGTNYYSKFQKHNTQILDSNVQASFLRPFTQEDWSYLQNNDPEAYIYYSNAKHWYDLLSPKMLQLFTTEELWYIYFFDPQLKYKLETFKE